MSSRELMKLAWTFEGRDYRLKPAFRLGTNSFNRNTGQSSPVADLGGSEWDVYVKPGTAQPWRKSTIRVLGRSEQKAALNALDEGFRRAAWTDDFDVRVQARGLTFDDRQPIDRKRQLGREEGKTTGSLPSKGEVWRATTTGDRIKYRRAELQLSQTVLGQRAGLTQPTISALEQNRAQTSGQLASIAQVLQVNAFWLETGLGDMEPSTAPPDLNTIVVPLVPSEGNCGGTCLSAKLDYAPIHIRNDLFSRCQVAPVGRLIAAYGDGDSMSNFIMTGDILIFDTGACAISDGSIYLIDTPDGPRVKRLNRRADGRVVLRNDNKDKGRYPDEEYTVEQARSLSIKGKLVLRIAGS